MARKRPHGKKKTATIDLTATEIDRDEGVIIVEPAQMSDQTGVPEKIAEASKTETEAPRTEEEIYKGAVNEKVSFQRRDDPDVNARTDADALAGSMPVPPVAAGKSRGGFFSHTFAGLIGGVLAFLALGPLAGQISTYVPAFKVMSGGGETDALGSRLAALENAIAAQRMREADPSELAGLGGRLTAAEKEISDLTLARRALEGKATQLEDRVSRLASAGGKGSTATGGNLAERVKALESRLTRSGSGAAAVAEENTGQLQQQLSALRQEVETVRRRNSVSPEHVAQLKSGLKALEDQTADLKKGFAEMQDFADAVKKRTDEIGSKLAALPDVEEKVAPLSEKLTDLESEVAGVVSREKEMRAEGRNTALIIALGNLTRAVESGRAYQRVLTAFERLAPEGTDMTPVSKYAATGLTTLAELQTGFRKAAHDTAVAEASGGDTGWMGNLLANARNVVQVKSTKPLTGNGTPAVLSRMQAAVSDGNLAMALEESRTLGEQARQTMQSWLDKAQAKHAADSLLNNLETRILAALGGTAGRTTN